MDTDNGMADEGDLSAFRRFIDHSLNLEGLNQSPKKNGDPGRYHPALANHEAFMQDLRRVWNHLHRENPGASYWGSRLTPLELETRGILQELILTGFRSVLRARQPRMICAL